MGLYRCSDKTCPVSGRDLDESVKVCAKCGSEVKLVKEPVKEQVVKHTPSNRKDGTCAWGAGRK